MDDSDEPKKAKAGRPSKYTDETPGRLFELMAEGYSFVACCGALGITEVTGHQWVKRHKEFADAKELGQAAGQHYWEKLAKDAIILDKDLKFSAPTWIFTMKNRFGWRDKTEITGADGGPLEIQNLSDQQIDNKITEIMARLGGGDDAKPDKKSRGKRSKRKPRATKK